MSNKINKSVKLTASENRLKALKKLGYLKDIKAPTKNKPLTVVQKARILKNYNDIKEVLTAPDNAFKKIKIDKFQKDDIKLLKKSGYKVKGDNIFIPTEGSNSVSIKNTYSRDKMGIERYLTITRKSTMHGRTKTVQEFLGTSIEKYEYQERLKREKSAAKIKDDEMFGLKLYENGMFRREIQTDLNSAFKYLENDFQINEGAPKNVLLDNIHLVKITIDNRPMDFNNMNKLDTYDDKKRGKDIYQRRKKNNQLRGKIKRK